MAGCIAHLILHVVSCLAYLILHIVSCLAHLILYVVSYLAHLILHIVLAHLILHSHLWPENDKILIRIWKILVDMLIYKWVSASWISQIPQWWQSGTRWIINLDPSKTQHPLKTIVRHKIPGPSKNRCLATGLLWKSQGKKIVGQKFGSHVSPLPSPGITPCPQWSYQNIVYVCSRKDCDV